MLSLVAPVQAPPRTLRAPAPAVAALTAIAVGLLFSDNTDAAGTLARTVGYSATLVALGGHLFVVLAHSHGGRAEAESLYRVVWMATCVAVVGGFAQLAVLASAVAGHGWARLPGVAAFEEAILSSVHISAVVRFLGLALALRGLGQMLAPRLDAAQRAVARQLVTIGVLIAAASFAVTGHAATRSPRALAVAADLVHVLGASLWLGGLVALFVVARHRRRPELLAEVARRYASLMLVVVVALLASGVALTLLEFDGDLGAIGRSNYGAALLAKMGLAVAVLGLGAASHRRSVPALAGPGAASAATTLLRRAWWEIGGLSVVVVLTALLTGMAR